METKPVFYYPSKSYNIEHNNEYILLCNNFIDIFKSNNIDYIQPDTITIREESKMYVVYVILNDIYHYINNNLLHNDKLIIYKKFFESSSYEEMINTFNVINKIKNN